MSYFVVHTYIHNTSTVRLPRYLTIYLYRLVAGSTWTDTTVTRYHRDIAVSHLCLISHVALLIMPAPTGIKLRESCQACAMSKIKCSKDKPQCNRCTEKGTVCQYLVTKRTGRKVRRQDSTSGETVVSPSSPNNTALSSPERELESAAPDLPMLDSHFGALDTAIL